MIIIETGCNIKKYTPTVLWWFCVTKLSQNYIPKFTPPSEENSWKNRRLNTLSIMNFLFGNVSDEHFKTFTILRPLNISNIELRAVINNKIPTFVGHETKNIIGLSHTTGILRQSPSNWLPNSIILLNFSKFCFNPQLNQKSTSSFSPVITFSHRNAFDNTSWHLFQI